MKFETSVQFLQEKQIPLKEFEFFIILDWAIHVIFSTIYLFGIEILLDKLKQWNVIINVQYVAMHVTKENAPNVFNKLQRGANDFID